MIAATSGETRSERPRTGGGWTARALAAVALTGVQGCTLPDVPLPQGDDVLIVEAVLRTDERVQRVLLHRSIAGRVAAGEPGAVVRVRTDDGREIAFLHAGGGCHPPPTFDPEGDEVRVQASCFVSEASAAREGESWVEPGRAYELTVETPRGERVRGRTVVPGGFGLAGLAYSAVRELQPPRCALPAATPLTVRWTAAEGAWAYIAPLRVAGLAAALEPLGLAAPEPLDLVGVSVSAADTSIVLPTEFGVFDRFRYDQDLLRALQRGLPAGVEVTLAVAAADRNYVNGVRGGSFNPSGRVRVSSVAGDGVGVFGSLVPLHARMVVGPAPGVPPCALP
jgi:hypothetical protein